MRTWIITALLTATLLALAVTAGWWGPTLLTMVTDNMTFVYHVTLGAQVTLWLLAALVGAAGTRRALDQRGRAPGAGAGADAKAQAPAPEGRATAPTGRATTQGQSGANDAAEAGSQGTGSGADTELDSDMVTFYTAGGVRIIAEGSSLELEEGEGGIKPAPAGKPTAATVEILPLPPGENRAPAGAKSTMSSEVPGVLAATAAVSAGARKKRKGRKREVEPAAPSESPASLPSPVITTPFNLPADLADFTGRADESAAVHRRLSQTGQSSSVRRRRAPSERLRDGGRSDADRRLGADGPSRTVAISGIAGMGGIGKTALALHVAHELVAQDRFPDAQLYIDLKGTEPKPLEPAAALKALLSALVGPDPGRPEDRGTLARMWRAALQGKRALLVLDNAADAAQVTPLLPGWPSCAVLVTSRRRFKLPGAGLLDLNRLKPEDARALLQRLVPRLEDGEADEIAELCGGLPLALRIAGNHLALNDDVPAGEFAARLADQRDLLVHLRDPENPDLDVLATLSLSVAQLQAGTLWAWTMLSLFPAPFDPLAAGALWGDGVARKAWDRLDEHTTLEWLETLHNRSLVAYDSQTGRYRLHDLLNLAASEALESEAEAEGARPRLLYHYLTVVHEVDKRQRYLELDPEWPHLQAALDYAEQDLDLFSELVLALNNYWSARGMAGERVEWNQRAAKASAQAQRRHLEGIHLGHMGQAYADQGDVQRAIEYYAQALTLARGNGDRLVEANLLGNLGQAYASLGETQQGIRYQEQALEMARAVGDRRGEGTHLGNLGSAYAGLGEPQRAVKCHIEALSIAQETGDRRMEGILLGNLGQAYADLGEVRQAIECQKQAMAIHRGVGDLRGEAAALDSLGRAYSDLGQPRRAIDYYEQALEIAQDIGDRRGEGADLGNLGQAHADMGDPKRAISYYDQALEIADQTGDRRNEGICLGRMGRAYMELGDIEQAMSCFERALHIAQETGDRRNEAAWLGNLGQAHAGLGKMLPAANYHQRALTISQEIGDRRSEGNHLASLGMLARMDGDADRAHEVWLSALRTLESLKDPNAGQVWQWLAELEGQTS